ncbi:MAG: FAD-dependent oxidoreductase [Chloroflexi bacterium]|nr:FAD-dependent oxidoreductase [Chloroflexota bacterium]
MKDITIIGGGPAGMTAAVYTARKKLDLQMVAHDLGGQASWSWSVENYMGFSYIKGIDLMHRFEEHMRQFKFEVDYSIVTHVRKEGDHFIVGREGDEETATRSVIVASGKSPRHLDVPGEDRLIGRGISYCATCDAPIFKGMDVVVVGGGNSALTSAIQLLSYARNIGIISYEDWTGDPVLQDQLTTEQNVNIFKYSEITEIIGEHMVSAVRVRNRRSGEETFIPVRGVFVEIGQVPNSGLVKDLVSLNRRGEIMINCDCTTSVPGLFAAGDVTNIPEKQIIIAAGEGAKAALAAYKYLIGHQWEEKKAA